MVTHDLKIWTPYFNAVADGSKTFELRSDAGRKFQEGDLLYLREYTPPGATIAGPCYTGRVLKARVSYVLRGAPNFGLLADHVIMSLADVEVVS